MSRPTKGQFVILEHRKNRQVHWDFMAEKGGTLETWRLDLSPDKLSGCNCNAVKILDHPLRFLSYEGPVNQGEGMVKSVESGTYILLEESHNSRRLELKGKILKGQCTLTHIEAERWKISFS
jgi:hypothetical protein